MTCMKLTHLFPTPDRVLGSWGSIHGIAPSFRAHLRFALWWLSCRTWVTGQTFCRTWVDGESERVAYMVPGLDKSGLFLVTLSGQVLVHRCRPVVNLSHPRPHIIVQQRAYSNVAFSFGDRLVCVSGLRLWSIDPPLPRLLALRRAIAYILHLSVVGAYINKMLDNMGGKAVRVDWSTELSHVISLKLYRWVNFDPNQSTT